MPAEKGQLRPPHVRSRSPSPVQSQLPDAGAGASLGSWAAGGCTGLAWHVGGHSEGHAVSKVGARANRRRSLGLVDSRGEQAKGLQAAVGQQAGGCGHALLRQWPGRGWRRSTQTGVPGSGGRAGGGGRGRGPALRNTCCCRHPQSHSHRADSLGSHRSDPRTQAGREEGGWRKERKTWARRGPSGARG